MPDSDSVMISADNDQRTGALTQPRRRRLLVLATLLLVAAAVLAVSVFFDPLYGASRALLMKGQGVAREAEWPSLEASLGELVESAVAAEAPPADGALFVEEAAAQEIRPLPAELMRRLASARPVTGGKGYYLILKTDARREALVETRRVLESSALPWAEGHMRELSARFSDLYCLWLGPFDSYSHARAEQKRWVHELKNASAMSAR